MPEFPDDWPRGVAPGRLGYPHREEWEAGSEDSGVHVNPDVRSHVSKRRGLKEEVLAGLFLGGGSLVEEDTQEALFWLRRGAAKGNRFCQLNLGEFYENGVAVEQDREAARRLYRQASADAELALDAVERLKALDKDEKE